MQCSVVIPTYNRADILRENLECLEKQEFVRGEFEVVVVDDGSSDGTENAVKSFQKKNILALQYLRQQNQGQGIARNRGVQLAQGKIVIFIGDDILVRPDFLKQHMEYHRRYYHEHEAVLGLVLWDPRIPQTPFTDFMTRGGIFFGRFGGHQFAYDRLQGKEVADFNFFYTSNISLKKNLLLKHPFDDSFHGYGWEDIELGYRLTKEADMTLYYNSHAIGYHYHPMDSDSLASRLRAVGRSAHILHKKYPELGKVPPTWKRFIFQCMTSPFFIRQSKSLMEKFGGDWHYLYYYLVSKKAFLEGIDEVI